MLGGFTLQAWSLIAVCVTAQVIQPQRVITVESLPARRVFGTVVAPDGSPWCDGRPMYWPVGHQPTSESPSCLTDQGWVRSPLVVLDTIDSLNAMDGSTVIDRHDCAAVDVDGDGIADLICGVGADKGERHGFTELYLTTNSGTLQKVSDGHGLHRFTTLRVRFVVSLSDPFGNLLIFMATHGHRRSDGATNSHKLFRRVFNESEPGVFNETEPGEAPRFYFEDAAEEPSPLTQYTDASLVVVADFNGDNIDDLLVGNKKDPALLFVQESDGQWKHVPIGDGRKTKDWRSARVADFTGDGIPDLIVSDWGGRLGEKPLNSTITMFRGFREPPYFDFTSQGVLFEKTMPHATPAIEVFDFNGDGVWDVYVVQTDEMTDGSYCAGTFSNRRFWGKGVNPPASFVPPLDVAHDFLFIGQSTYQPSFEIVRMNHSEPGCGFMVERFQNNSLLLAQGTRDRPGHNLLLEW
jgi:hypothetical protein